MGSKRVVSKPDTMCSVPYGQELHLLDKLLKTKREQAGTLLRYLLYDFSNVMFYHPVLLHVLVIKGHGMIFQNGNLKNLN